MNNVNPTLLMGFVLRWLAERVPDMRDHEQQRVQLRVYGDDGYWFVRADGPSRWYWQDNDTDDGHFSRADTDVVQTAIASGAHVQITGNRNQSLGLWDNWQAFEREVLNARI